MENMMSKSHPKALYVSKCPSMCCHQLLSCISKIHFMARFIVAPSFLTLSTCAARRWKALAILYNLVYRRRGRKNDR